MNAPPSWDARRDAAAIALLVVLALALQLLVHDRWVSLLDEGAIAQMADQIRHGKPPYQNGVHLALPGIFYVTAALYATFGASLLVGRLMMVAAFTALVVLVYVLARSVAGRSAALAVGLVCVAYRIWAFPHWQMLSYAPLAILLLVIAVAVLMTDTGQTRRRSIPWAGAICGIAIVFKQDSAGIGFVCLGLYVLLSVLRVSGSWSTALKQGVLFGISGVLPLLLVLLAFAPAGLTGEIFHQTIWLPLVAKPLWTSTAGGGDYTAFPTVWPPWETAEAIRGKGFFTYFPGLLLDLYWRQILESPLFKQTLLPETFVRCVFLLPYALLLGLVARVIWTARTRPDAAGSRGVEQRMWLILSFAAAAILSFNRPRDWVHLLVLYPATILLLAPAIEIAAGTATGLRRRIVLGVAITAAASALALSFAIAFAAREHYSTPIRSERAGVHATPHVAAVLNPLLEQLATPADTSPTALAALPASPTLNFLLERPLVTRFLTLLPMREFSDRGAQVLADLARHPDADIVYSLNRAAYTPRPQDYMPEVFDALIDRYQLGSGAGGVFNGTRTDGLLLVRLERRSATRERMLYDFAEQLGNATLHVVGGEAQDLAPDAAELDRWPFEAPVVTFAPPQPPHVHELRYRFETGTAGRLRFGAAMNPDTWAGFLRCSLHFSVVLDGMPIFETTLDPRSELADRRWAWADLPIPPGEHEVGFRVSAGNAFCAAPDIAGWARPRLVRDE